MTTYPDLGRLSQAVTASIISLVCTGATGAFATPAGPPLATGVPPAEAPFESAAWLAEVELLATPAEREAFLALGDDAARRAFVRRFWEVRDPYRETAVNELEERWAARLAETRRRWTPGDERTRLFLLRGEPAATFTSSCAEAPVEVWDYPPRFGVKSRSLFAFVLGADGGPARLWRPGPKAPGLSPSSPETCPEGRRLAEAERWIRLTGDENYRGMIERALAPPTPEPADWLATFAAPAAEPPEGAATLEAELAVDFPGRDHGRTVMRGLVTLPLGALRPAGPGPRELLLTGEVVGERQVLDSFRYRFLVPPDAIHAKLPIAFERHLQPGRYTLRVILQDLLARAFFRGERELAVPRLGGGAVSPAAPAAVATPVPRAAAPASPARATPPSLAEVFSEAAAELRAGRPLLRLAPPDGGLLTGPTRFEARVEQAPDLPGIESVAFLLDGRRVATRTQPPFAVTLDLGPTPRVWTLRAEGLSSAGEPIAGDELLVNAGAQRFAVDLVEPRPGGSYRRSLRARAEVRPPEGRAVERVELWLDERLVATLYQPPYSLPMPLDREGAAAYVRAVAYLADGSAAEDVVFVNLPATAHGTALEVRLVELYTSVLDRSGRPVDGLAAGRFRVLKDGVPQALRELGPAADVPFRCAVLLDNSFSMRGHLDATRQAALGFLKSALGERDQAAVITFNRSPRLTVPLTGDLAALERGMAGLVAEDKTSLYDSVLFGLNYLAGSRGQRALLLLSDGKDQGSRFGFEQALEYARRTGIPIYAIGLALPKGERDDAVDRLRQLAAETGGRSFSVDGTAELPAVYAAIEQDLRSQYRITYQSTNTEPDGRFRTVAVEAGEGLEARTISGYYP